MGTYYPAQLRLSRSALSTYRPNERLFRGNFGQTMGIVHKAKVDGDTLTGTADIGDMGSIAFKAKRKQ